MTTWNLPSLQLQLQHRLERRYLPRGHLNYLLHLYPSKLHRPLPSSSIPYRNLPYSSIPYRNLPHSSN
jgi:hypothetical protein